VAPFGRQNYQIQRVSLLDFQPALAARAGGVGCPGGFRHDALMALVERLVQEFGGTFRVPGDGVRHQRVGRRQLHEGLEPPRLRFIQQRLAIQV